MNEDKNKEVNATDIPVDIYGEIFSCLNFSDFINFTLANKAISKLPYAQIQPLWRKWFEQYFPGDYKKYNADSNSSANTEINWHHAFIASYKNKHLILNDERTRLIFCYLKENNIAALQNENFKFTDLDIEHGEEILDWVIKYGSQEIKNYLFDFLKNLLSPEKIEKSTLKNCENIFNRFLHKFHKDIESTIAFSQDKHGTQKPTSDFNAASELMVFYAVLLNQPKEKINCLKNNTALSSVTRHTETVILPLAIKNKCHELINDNLTNFQVIRHTGKESRTLLHYAVSAGDIEMIKYLKERKVDVNALDHNNKTPLHYAASAGNLEIVKYLIENGSKKEIDARDGYRKTPLHYAVLTGNLKLVAYLIENEANINVLDGNGKTPFFCAISAGCTQVVKYFIDKKFYVHTAMLQYAASDHYKPHTLEYLWKAYIATNGAAPNFNPASQLLMSVKEKKRAIATKDKDLFFESDFLMITFKSDLFRNITIADNINTAITFKKNEKNKNLSAFCVNFNALIAVEALIEILKKRKIPEKRAVLENLRNRILDAMDANALLDVDTWLSESDRRILNTSPHGIHIGLFRKKETSALAKTDVLIFIENLAATIKRYTPSASPSAPTANLSSQRNLPHA